MRKVFSALALSFGLMAISNDVYAQPSLGCVDPAIRIQVEQMKKDFKAQGLEVYRDAMLGMESREPSPVAVQLTQGKLYQLVFVGHKDATKIDFELFDYNDKKIDSRQLKNGENNNMIIYSFVPDKSDMFMIVLTQTVKNKTVCGGFTIMQQPDEKPVEAATENKTAEEKKENTTTKPTNKVKPAKN